VGAGLVWHSVTVRTDGEHDSSPRASEPIPERGSDPQTGAVLVDLKDGVDLDQRRGIARELTAAIAPHPWPSGSAALGTQLSKAARLFRLEPPRGEIGDVLRALSDEPAVEAVERERVWSLPEGAQGGLPLGALRPGEPEPSRGPKPFVPNDPYYKHQWHLDQIQMPQAWARNQGEDVIVAVIDTGVLARDRGKFRQAPDLAKTRFVPGRDLVDGDAHPDDEHGHGTHVAGTVAQSTHNALGVAGVAPKAAIMPVRVLDRRGAGRWGTVAAGIRWAADHGADVINLSLGGSISSQTIRRAVEHAHRKGVVVVAAAGNTGRPRVGYPAAYPHVLAVGSVRYDETLAFYSAHGKGLDLVAPGGDLRVDQNGDGLPDGVLQNTMVRGDPSRHDYLVFQGTSMAAPHAAGAAALLRSSGVRDPDTVQGILQRTAKDKDDRQRYGAGLIQVSEALSAARQGFGGARGMLAVLLGMGLLLGLRRRGRLDVDRLPVLGTAFALAGGLALVPWSLFGGGFGLAALADGLPAGLVRALGSWGATVVLSAAIPLVLAGLLLGSRRLRPVVVGAAAAFGAHLIVEAVVPTTGLALVPGWAEGPWLLSHGVLALAIGRAAATSAPRGQHAPAA
jgi:serine protease